jgi:hypothetical protein
MTPEELARLEKEREKKDEETDKAGDQVDGTS